jgi:hypothetical protein
MSPTIPSFWTIWRGFWCDCSGWTRRPGRPSDWHSSRHGKPEVFCCLARFGGCSTTRKGRSTRLGRGLELDPGAVGALQSSSHFRKLLARSLLQLGRPAEARQALEAIRASNRIDGLAPEAEWLTSRAWLQEGKLPEAAAALTLAGSYRALNLLIPEPSPFVGAASCVSCHREESRSHEKSRHARTFHHGRGLLELPFPDRPLFDPDDPKVTHTRTTSRLRPRPATRSTNSSSSTPLESPAAT